MKGFDKANSFEKLIEFYTSFSQNMISKWILVPEKNCWNMASQFIDFSVYTFVYIISLSTQIYMYIASNPSDWPFYSNVYNHQNMDLENP